MSDITLITLPSEFLLNDHVFPPLGILYLSSYLERFEISTECCDLGITHKEDFNSKIVGISFTTPQRTQAYALMRELNKKGYMTIAGGPHPTHQALECLNAGFHAVFTGYAEHSLLNWLKSDDKPKGIFESIEIVSLDSLPFPNRGKLPIQKYKYSIDGIPATVIITSRGCFAKCSFCARIDKTFKLQSAQRTIDEINMLNRYYGYKAFMIFDDCFASDKKRFKEIVDGVENKGYKFRCFCRSNLITDDRCALMKRMGVVEVGLGVESGSNKILQSNMKGTNVNLNTKAVELLRKHGIRSKTFLIVGLPGESEDTIKDTWNWIETVRPDDLDVSLFQPLPGSDIFNNSDNYDIKFNYNKNSNWFKGTPGKYSTTVCTKEMQSDRLIYWRDKLEETFKKKELLK